MKQVYKRYLLATVALLINGCASGDPSIPTSLNMDGKAQFIGVDKMCENMYESYDLNLESAMSIGMILASKKIESFTNKFNMSASKSNIGESDIKKLARAVAKESFWVPLEFEKLYAENIIDQRLKDGKLITRNTKNKKYKNMYKELDAFGEQYKKYAKEQNSNFPFEIETYITTDKDVAESIPYGKIIISESFMNDGRYKTILAHEISHITKRHTTKEMQFRIISMADSTTDIVSIVSKVQSDDSQKIKQLFQAANIEEKFEKYSQDMELEADACGIKVLSAMNPENKNKYLGEMILNIDRTMQDENARDYKIKEHPNKEIRINNMKEVSKKI